MTARQDEAPAIAVATVRPAARRRPGPKSPGAAARSVGARTRTGAAGAYGGTSAAVPYNSLVAEADTAADTASDTAADSAADSAVGPLAGLAEPSEPPYRKRRLTVLRPGVARREAVLGTTLAVGLVLLALLSVGVGAYHIGTGDVVASVAHRIGFGCHRLDRVGESVLWDVRVPRVVLAVLVGASLGCAGALMQGVFGNPLAEPGVIGISSGAAVGAAGSIALGLGFAGNWTVTVCAFGAGLLTVLAVYGLSRSGGRTEVVTLVLTGIAVNAFAGAAIGLCVFYADNAQLTEITFWQLGSLSQATWPKVLAVLPCAAAGLAVAPFFARRLDLLALGERQARHLGVDVERMRLALIAVVALLTAAAVAVAGIVSFVGLVVPHLLRMAAAPATASSCRAARSAARWFWWPPTSPRGPSRRRRNSRSGC